jgi:hypothetical protein
VANALARSGIVAILLLEVGVALSGCSSATATPQATPTPLTAADHSYLDALRETHRFSVTTANERGWLQIGDRVCTGISAKGVSKYMAEVGRHQYRAILVVAPIAIRSFCPQDSKTYNTWQGSRG